MMTSDEIRKSFLDFFSTRGHRIVPSDTLVPKDDPTVLFTTAGMQQFKRQFLGQVGDYTRAASSQKCLRTDDLDQVGQTPFHHTFFEMLGNFSFGDYFKKEAIVWAWEFLTQVIKLPVDKLWVSVYQEDTEAETIWLKTIGIPAQRVVRLGDKSNFWPSEAKTKGPNGPCGPCSEIFYDYGVNSRCLKGDDCNPACDCGRFSEIWNLVFTQFNRKDGGALEPLPNKNIDTGMGLERLTAVVQGKRNNFDTDLFQLIRESLVKELLKLKVTLSQAEEFIVADHVRAITVAIADGVIPSNKERGSVVKRLITDSANIILRQGVDKPVIYKFLSAVTKTMSKAYPELEKKLPEISNLVMNTEEAFISVRKQRIPELKERITELLTNLRQSPAEVSFIEELGELFFIFRDTYGLPLSAILDVIQKTPEINENDHQAALAIYHKRMQEQQERSRLSSKMIGDVFIPDEVSINVSATQFVGYELTKAPGNILKIIVANQPVASAEKGTELQVILDRTPFYAEAGGQVGDTGKIISPSGVIRVIDTRKINDVFIHQGVVEQGQIRQNESITAQIDEERRLSIMRNHTATHLLQAALRHVLGNHVQQQGSFVDEERLRFDFSHPQALTEDQLSQIEDYVFRRILSCDNVLKEIVPIAKARERGALAFFAEKYGETVRIVSIPDVSQEFCGGTHLESTGQIGLLKIISESSIAQGIRRIEAKTGWGAYALLKEKEMQLQKVSNLIKANPNDIIDRIELQSRRLKGLEKELETFLFENIKNSLPQVINRAEHFGETMVVIENFQNVEMSNLRRIADLLRQKTKSNILLLASQQLENAYLLAVVSDDLVARGVKANELISVVAPCIKGSGGGKPQIAQAGSHDTQNIAQALQVGKSWISEKLKIH
jgi:alanyl-tRNA synthetase